MIIERAMLYYEEDKINHNQVFNRDITHKPTIFMWQSVAFIIIMFNFPWRWALINLSVLNGKLYGAKYGIV